MTIAVNLNLNKCEIARKKVFRGVKEAKFKELLWMALPHNGHQSLQVFLNGASCRARALSNDPPDFISEGTQATDLKCFRLKMQGHIRHT